MVRETLNRQIHHILEETLLLGSMVEQAILNAVEALKTRDIKTSKEIIDEDQIINDKRFAIENAVLILISTQQPVAHDLRILTAVLEISTELERIGDYAKGIARIVIKLDNESIPIPIRELSRMAEVGVSMLHRALGAFITENARQASQIPAEDDEIDELYNQVYRTMVNAMISDPTIIDSANLILWAAHNLERTADRVTNLCERTVFIATGELMEIDSSYDEDMDASS
ncbi:MAG: phosphate signaling complex protein PhoU [Anaerolineaceae bacterium]|nr:phosphate signaling complex protein PhoU [Anaerolineaceae bacterium]